MRSFQLEWNRNLQKDKQKHFLYGLTIMLCVSSIAIFLKYGPLVPMISCQLLGYGVEFAQTFTRSRVVDPSDAYATVAGGVFGVCIAYLGLLLCPFLWN